MERKFAYAEEFFFLPRGGLRKGTTSEGSPSISVGRRGLADKNREGFLFPVEIGIKHRKVLSVFQEAVGEIFNLSLFASVPLKSC